MALTHCQPKQITLLAQGFFFCLVIVFYCFLPPCADSEEAEEDEWGQNRIRECMILSALSIQVVSFFLLFKTKSIQIPTRKHAELSGQHQTQGQLVNCTKIRLLTKCSACWILRFTLHWISRLVGFWHVPIFTIASN